jgi:hypothetical protein
MGAYHTNISVPELRQQAELLRPDLDDVRLADLPNAIPVPLAFVELIAPPVEAGV